MLGPVQQLLGETELNAPSTEEPGSREQTHLPALRDSTDGALGVTLAA